MMRSDRHCVVSGFMNFSDYTYYVGQQKSWGQKLLGMMDSIKDWLRNPPTQNSFRRSKYMVKSLENEWIFFWANAQVHPFLHSLHKHFWLSNN